jgi:hypothetical protein
MLSDSMFCLQFCYLFALCSVPLLMCILIFGDKVVYGLALMQPHFSSIHSM